MKFKYKNFIKNAIVSFDKNSRHLLDKSRLTHPIYEKIILPLEVAVYQSNDYKLVPSFKKEFKEAKETYIAPNRHNDTEYLKKTAKGIVIAHICYHMNADEYFLYDFEHQDYWQRWEWLADRDRMDLLVERFGESVFAELTDKSYFYQLAHPYFRRDLCFIGKDHSSDDFLKFTESHPRFIIKPIDGSLGANTFVATIGSKEEAADFYKKQLEKGSWVVEELVVQCKETAEWNESSVNTMRVPSFRTKDGVHILQPFFRTGRKGSVVDNAGHGGIFAVFDADSGMITTDGVDEHGGRFECHPDSGKKFKGWQIPHWEELKALVKEVHHSLPEHHRYVGFDFALDKDYQWILIEGNWGQMVGQMAELKGIRRPFIEYIS